ncbi:MAG TPA: hypothetical protein VL282_13665 [Tepidisphaeraceae bacterium]|nr:hypothetical protein [Tepidisphaeraceae bacterium]
MLCGSISFSPSFTFAQPAPQQQQKSAGGLDSLSDEPVMTELANRGMDVLLDRAFAVNNVPKAKQDGIRTLIALQKISDPKIPASQRQELITQITKGIEAALPTLNDPRMLMQQAGILITAGAERDVNTLEYWGENPRTQASLQPIVATVQKILEKAQATATSESERIANSLKSPDDPAISKYMELDQLARTAEYTKNMVAYYRALSLDPASPERGKIANEAIEYLKQFDDPDSNVQPAVRNRIAKLNMVKGTYDEAKKLFDTIIKKDPAIKPAPDVAQQYEARYFRAVADLMGRAPNPDAAKKGLDELIAWQGANLPRDKATQDGASAAAAMLEYRIANARADIAKTDADKKAANDQAVGILMKLLKDRPDLQGIIYEQLMARLPKDAPMTGMDPLLLRALVSRGEAERLKKDESTIDKPTLERAIQAAKELVALQGKQSVDQSLAENSALLIGLFLEKLDRDVEAGNAYLNFIKQFPQSTKAKAALEQCEVLIGQLRKDRAEEKDVVDLLERFLPVAINPPFNEKRFAFQYAVRLQALGKYKEAIAYYRQVPEGERTIFARFGEMVAHRALLGTMKQDDPQRTATLAEIQNTADQVNKMAASALASAKDEKEKQQYHSIQVKTALLAADVSWREQKDPKRTLELLQDFEDQVKGLPGEGDLLSEVLFLRVQSYMAAGQTDAATQTLLKLLESRPGGQGAQIIYGLLEKLNADLDKAQAAGDSDRIRTLTNNRAQLSGFLVDYAEKSDKPETKKQVYVYKRFAAMTKYEAALLVPDEAKRKEQLQQALAAFKALTEPENVALYKSSINPNSGADPNYPDPQVSLRIGLIAYDLGDFQEAQNRLGKLLNDRKLGTAVIEETDTNGINKTIDNEQYWEAVLKLLQSNLALNVDKKQIADYLTKQYNRWGERVGGTKWKKDFEALRAELGVEGSTSQPVQ